MNFKKKSKYDADKCIDWRDQKVRNKVKTRLCVNKWFQVAVTFVILVAIRIMLELTYGI